MIKHIFVSLAAMVASSSIHAGNGAGVFNDTASSQQPTGDQQEHNLAESENTPVDLEWAEAYGTEVPIVAHKVMPNFDGKGH